MVIPSMSILGNMVVPAKLTVKYFICESWWACEPSEHSRHDNHDNDADSKDPSLEQCVNAMPNYWKNFG